MTTHGEELVVLCSSDGEVVGTAPKATVHTADTPLHFAFSCYLQRSDGKVLLTRRALVKKTWPGVWTNSFCGHPGVDELPADALRRRAEQELGFDGYGQLSRVDMVLPEFSYRATDSSGIVEWEICPVFVAQFSGELNPSADEVDAYEWVTPQQLFEAVDATPFAFSPWMVLQLSHPELRQHLLGATAQGR